MTRFPYVGRFHLPRDGTSNHFWIHICHISSHWLIWVWWSRVAEHCPFDVSTSGVSRSINAMIHLCRVLSTDSFCCYKCDSCRSWRWKPSISMLLADLPQTTVMIPRMAQRSGIWLLLFFFCLLASLRCGELQIEWMIKLTSSQAPRCTSWKAEKMKSWEAH